MPDNMAEIKKEISEVHSRLDRMDEARDNTPLLQKVDKIIRIVDRLETELAHVKERTDETHLVLLGNGHPEKGLVHRFNMFVGERQPIVEKFEVRLNELKGHLSYVENKLKKHLADHKEITATWRDRAWDLAKPILTTIISLIILALGAWAIYGQRIIELLSD